MDLGIVQSGIFEAVPKHGRFLYFQLKHYAKADALSRCLDDVASDIDGQSAVLGLGEACLAKLEAEGLESLEFPTYETRDVQVPSTPAALMIWLRADDQGDMLHLAQTLLSKLSACFELESNVEAFTYKEGRDLTGYEDGTENPQGEEAFDVAFSQSPAGGSYLAIQQWQHDLAFFKSKPQQEQDHTFGRRLSDNKELGDAPESAHVKRTEQEGFAPETFLLRRSMAYGDGEKAGLMFLGFGATTESFNRMMAKMVGKEDGIVDSLFTFTRPLTGAFFWCPPMSDGKIKLR
ncbi:Dyp-type peroxidase [Oceaniserpentilla sp. 4NH20-0058]|uniref:Dyp-type peroxidase n=1 Tax=Oceaniserpentilla sp. 4NH20-0058 TaxID=3127660 RepID=UPI003104DBE6